jgi:hypothetical protein
VQVEDTKVNRHLGIWSILEKQFKISILNGKRSETLEAESGKLVFTCGIEIPISSIDLTVHVLSRFRNSVLIFGDYHVSSEILDTILNKSKHLQDSDPNSWLPLASYLISQDLSGVRLFGLFDDIENGVVVYEPLTVYNASGDWKSRQSRPASRVQA